VGVPPSIVQAVAPTVKTSAPPQGSTPAIIDPPSDKGKQKAEEELPRLGRSTLEF
jgi:hypothetical protein